MRGFCSKTFVMWSSDESHFHLQTTSISDKRTKCAGIEPADHLHFIWNHCNLAIITNHLSLPFLWANWWTSHVCRFPNESRHESSSSQRTQRSSRRASNRCSHGEGSACRALMLIQREKPGIEPTASTKRESTDDQFHIHFAMIKEWNAPELNQQTTYISSEITAIWP